MLMKRTSLNSPKRTTTSRSSVSCAPMLSTDLSNANSTCENTRSGFGLAGSATGLGAGAGAGAGAAGAGAGVAGAGAGAGATGASSVVAQATSAASAAAQTKFWAILLSIVVLPRTECPHLSTGL